MWNVAEGVVAGMWGGCARVVSHARGAGLTNEDSEACYEQCRYRLNYAHFQSRKWVGFKASQVLTFQTQLVEQKSHEKSNKRNTQEKGEYMCVDFFNFSLRTLSYVYSIITVHYTVDIGLREHIARCLLVVTAY